LPLIIFITGRECCEAVETQQEAVTSGLYFQFMY